MDDAGLIGGSTRIPKIQSMLSDFFGRVWGSGFRV